MVNNLPQEIRGNDRLPSITVEEVDQGGPSGNRSLSYTNPTDCLSPGLDDSSESQHYFTNLKRGRCRGRMHKSHIKVKYTKVYGESDGAYRNDSTPRGLVFLCNFSKFDKYPDREGSERDYENLLNLFQQMGYGYTHRRNRYCQTGNITKKEFMEKLLAFSNEKKHQMFCSCVIIIMSHGSGPKTFITSDDQEVDLMDVYSIFDNIHCEALRGKPKIFILQFCRNIPDVKLDQRTRKLLMTEPIPNDLLRMIIREEVERLLQSRPAHHQHPHDGKNTPMDTGPTSPIYLAIERLSRNPSFSSLSSLIDPTTSQVTDTHDTKGHINSDSYHSDTRNVPSTPKEGVQRYSDMYSIFSTSPGELSHRDPHKGSLLIQAICHVFAEFAYQDDIDTLVRKVSTYMTKTLQKDDPITVPRQTCERTNNGLDKCFYFNPVEIPYCRHVTI
ncbi:uncharacterized protein LOC121862919 [Homarus americanus]|uniref:uncharacterized protein LOC121862919 n=1 Tax=Homarus americanus TaxID=6706 RepID=UPI001C461EDC|nr:uncharacterized protein LOC121862919 [Homarus americanus]